ncbi:MAG: carbon storage regulator [Oscillospiraceae bacterium]
MLVLSRKCGQVLHIGDDIHITISDIQGDKVKIAIDAPREMNIVRDELLQVVNANIAAVHKVENVSVKNLGAQLGKNMGQQKQ